MAHLITLEGKKLHISNKAFLASTAQIIGDVTIGDGSSIWYNVVLRGDVMPLIIGKDSNIQDGTVVHGTYHKCGTTVGDRVTVGHSAILHGCELGDESFVGMGAVVQRHRDAAHIRAGIVLATAEQFVRELPIARPDGEGVRERTRDVEVSRHYPKVADDSSLANASRPSNRQQPDEGGRQ